MHGSVPFKFRPTRKEITMATMTIPKKKDAEITMPPENSQNRRTFERYHLQVDRQMKQAYADYDAAEKVGAAIKKAHPIVQVSIYDSKDWETTVL